MFFMVTVLAMLECTLATPKFSDAGESCNSASGAWPVPVMVYVTIAWALLMISSRAEVFPVLEGRNVTVKWAIFEGKMLTGVEGPDTVNWPFEEYRW